VLAGAATSVLFGLQRHTTGEILARRSATSPGRCSCCAISPLCSALRPRVSSWAAPPRFLVETRAMWRQWLM